MTEVLAGLLILAGSGFFAIAALGLVVRGDSFLRFHALSVGSSFAIFPLLLAAAVASGEMAVVTRSLAAICFLLLTTPVSGHLLARAAYLSGIRPRLGPGGDAAKAYFRRLSPLAAIWHRHHSAPVEPLDPPLLDTAFGEDEPAEESE